MAGIARLDAPAPTGPWPPFDPDLLRKRGWRAWASRLPQVLVTQPTAMALFRRLWPTPLLGGTRLITRYDDAREALSRPDVFEVPWAEKMQELAPSRLPFVLATDDAGEHRRGEQAIMRAFRRDDACLVGGVVAHAAGRIVQGADNSLDAVKDLIAKVPIEVYRRYFGLRVPDGEDDEFALRLMAMANYTLRKVGPDEGARGVALAAAPRVRQVVDDAIARAKEGRAGGDTVVARLVALQGRDPENLPDDALRAMLTGVASAYVPAGTMAGGHILEVLLRRPEAMDAARRAARGGDDVALARCLLEALRLKPIHPGPWRRCTEDYTIAAGTARATRIRKGEAVLVLLQAAMRDGERVRDAGRFDPDRSAGASMVLGYGRHWCAGAHFAAAHLTQVFKPLLLRGFRRAPGPSGRLRYFGAIPEHLTLVLDPR